MVISFNPFWKFLRLRKFGIRLGIFWVLIFAPIRSFATLEIRSTPWGTGTYKCKTTGRSGRFLLQLIKLVDFLGEKEFGRAFLGLLKSVHIPGSQFYVKELHKFH